MVKHIRHYGGTAVTVILAVLAFGDAPEQLAKWKGYLIALWNLPGVDWGSFFNGNGGRWTLALLAVAVGLWSWEVPGRVIAKWQGKPFGNAVGLSGHVTWRRIAADSLEGKDIKINALTADLEAKNKEIADLNWSVEQVTGQRETALDAYKRCKHNFTMERFRRVGEDHPSVTVKIRTAGYGDWPLVQQIKKLFEEDARWKVDVDPNNVPPLMPNAHYKVVLETGELGTLHRLHSLLDMEDGGLLPVRVGVQHNPANQNNNRLIIEVLPIVNE